jgi:hypothetical protein
MRPVTGEFRIYIPTFWAYAAAFCAMFGLVRLCDYIIDKTLKLEVIK